MSDCYLPVRVGEKLDYSFDWTAWGTPATRQWTITPSLTLTNDTTATVTVAGFETGKVYRLSEDVEKSDGISGKRTIVLRTE